MSPIVFAMFPGLLPILVAVSAASVICLWLLGKWALGKIALMTPPKRPKRRWFQASLRMLFVAITVMCGWLAYEMNWIRQRRAFLDDEIGRCAETLGRFPSASYFVSPRRMPAPGILWLFGEDGLEYFNLVVKARNDAELTAADRERQALGKRLFPEAAIGFFHDLSESEPGEGVDSEPAIESTIAPAGLRVEVGN